MTLTKTTHMLVATAAVIGLALIAFTTSASAAACKAKGLKVAQHSHGVYVFYVDEDGTRETIACSERYGKRVSLGFTGETSDGETWVREPLIHERFVAYEAGSGGNVAGGGASVLVRTDLKTGASQNLPLWDPSDPNYPKSFPAGYGYNGLRKFVFDAGGDLTWIGETSPVGAGTLKQVFRADAGGSARRIASGMNIAVDLLRFAPDERTVVWATETGSELIGINREKKARKTGRRCDAGRHRVLLKKGHTIVFERAARRHAGMTELVACSTLYRRNVRLGEVGTSHGERVAREQLLVTGTSAAIVFRTRDGSGVTIARKLVRADLATGETAAEPAVNTFSPTHGITAIRLYRRGAVAWISGPANGDARSSQREVHVFDNFGARVVASGAAIDAQFLEFYPEPLLQVHWAKATAQG